MATRTVARTIVLLLTLFIPIVHLNAEEKGIGEQYSVTIYQETDRGEHLSIKAIGKELISLEIRPGEGAEEFFSVVTLRPIEDPELNEIIRRLAEKSVHSFLSDLSGSLNNVARGGIEVSITNDEDVLLKIKTSSLSFHDDLWAEIFDLESGGGRLASSFRRQFDTFVGNE